MYNNIFKENNIFQWSKTIFPITTLSRALHVLDNPSNEPFPSFIRRFAFIAVPAGDSYGLKLCPQEEQYQLAPRPRFYTKPPPRSVRGFMNESVKKRKAKGGWNKNYEESRIIFLFLLTYERDVSVATRHVSLHVPAVFVYPKPGALVYPFRIFYENKLLPISPRCRCWKSFTIVVSALSM